MATSASLFPSACWPSSVVVVAPLDSWELRVVEDGVVVIVAGPEVDDGSVVSDSMTSESGSVVSVSIVVVDIIIVELLVVTGASVVELMPSSLATCVDEVVVVCGESVLLDAEVVVGAVELDEAVGLPLFEARRLPLDDKLESEPPLVDEGKADFVPAAAAAESPEPFVVVAVPPEVGDVLVPSCSRCFIFITGESLADCSALLALLLLLPR